MKARVLHTRIWTDGFMRKLTPGEKLLYVYLLTNSKVNIIHCYEITIDEIIFDLGLSVRTIKDAVEKLSKEGKILRYKDWVFLGNADKYQRFTGEKNDIAKQRLFQEMSRDVLDWYDKIMDRGIKGVYIPSVISNKYIYRGVVKGGKEKNKGGVIYAEDL